ncbi:DUF4136 domain-containing protein [Hymenobacter sp. ASUV-10]|uniref:DUF4136 domain-containing protein n=1 Tax=Hymenobacter aranciens TaxID=3063996 RepID=A0ABT9BBM1_9BACT|nr:DUF4136 domain-containing protein [Hymenobacter sp. ASUV-10]MDO7874106.1 DUF4136 domain-containing protein [Hymenobacter sp. ASUV-10]
MKNPLRLLGFTLLLPVLGGCFTLHESRIESDYSYSGDFRYYKTYDFMREPSQAGDTTHLSAMLREAINTRLRQQGYHPATRRPDLLISYRLFEGTMRMRGYDQPDIQDWVANGVVQKEDADENSEHESYHPTRVLLTNGTLLITLVDARSQRAVWNGYASGVEVPDNALAEVVMRRSVRSIFDRYRVFTQGFLVNPDERQ